MEDILIFDAQMPEHYHRELGPFCFRPYAQEVANRLKDFPGSNLLELASGTGILTFELDAAFPPHWQIVASDITEDMLGLNRKHTAHSPRTTHQVIDAADIPFPDASFDIVVCQFGWMFFPDKDHCAREANRVLKPGGTLLFEVWGSLEENPAFGLADQVMADAFPSDPPQFILKPFGYHQETESARLASDAGFVNVTAERVAKTGVAPTADGLALGFYGGTPMVLAIANRDASRLDELRAELSKRLAERLGNDPVTAPMVSVIVTAKKP